MPADPEQMEARPSEVTEPVPPSDFSRMSSLYVRPFDTTVPASRTASADVAALRVFDWISVAGSFPTPFVPASGSSLPHPVSAVPVTTSAHIAPTSAALRVRPWEIAVTGRAAFHTGVHAGVQARVRARVRAGAHAGVAVPGVPNGVRQRTGAVRARRSQSVRTAHQGVSDRDGLA